MRTFVICVNVYIHFSVPCTSAVMVLEPAWAIALALYSAYSDLIVLSFRDFTDSKKSPG